MYTYVADGYYGSNIDRQTYRVGRRASDPNAYTLMIDGVRTADVSALEPLQSGDVIPLDAADGKLVLIGITADGSANGRLATMMLRVGEMKQRDIRFSIPMAFGETVKKQTLGMVVRANGAEVLYASGFLPEDERLTFTVPAHINKEDVLTVEFGFPDAEPAAGTDTTEKYVSFRFGPVSVEQME